MSSNPGIESTRRRWRAIWIIVGVVVAVGAGAAWMASWLPPWLAERQLREATVAGLPAWEEAVEVHGRCVAGQSPPSASAIFRGRVQSADAGVREARCDAALRDAIQGAAPEPASDQSVAVAVARFVAVATAPTDPAEAGTESASAEAACRRLDALRQRLVEIRQVLDGTKLVPADLECALSLARVPALQPPAKVGIEEALRWRPFLAERVGAELQLKVYQPHETMWLRTTDGATWAQLESLNSVDCRWPFVWQADRLWTFGKSAIGDRAITSHVHEAAGWDLRAPLDPGLEPVAVGIGGEELWTVVVQREDHALAVLRSRDGSRTWEGGLDLLGSTRTWQPDVHINADGTVVALALDGEAPVRFVAATAPAPGSPVTSATSASVDLPGLAAASTWRPPVSCGEGERRWAYAAERYLLSSGDSGRTWSVVTELIGPRRVVQPTLRCQGEHAWLLGSAEGAAPTGPRVVNVTTCALSGCGPLQPLVASPVERVAVGVGEAGLRVALVSDRVLVFEVGADDVRVLKDVLLPPAEADGAVWGLRIGEELFAFER